MRHLDANALAQLIRAMAEVVGAMTSPEGAASADVPSALEEALAAFHEGWRPLDPVRSSFLAAQAEQLAAAGMAFIEGDPVTAGQLVDGPARTAVGATAAATARTSGWTIRDHIVHLRAVSVAADEVAADLTGRRLARRAFSTVGEAIEAYRGLATGHLAAAAALETHLEVADATEERRRVVEELIDDTARAARGVPDAADRSSAVHLARLHDKAVSASDEMSASMDRCAADVRACIPASGDRETVVDAVGRSIEAVRELLALAAAGERRRFAHDGQQGPEAGDRRTMA